jgi:GDP-L-fucose synthase
MKLNKNTRIFLAGHKGMVGSAILKKLKRTGYKNIITRNRKQLDLLNQSKTFKFLKKYKPQFVIIAAARVGGILNNMKHKSEFLYENLQLQNNIIHGSYLASVKNLFLLGSSCIYPKLCKQPMKEEYLLTGSLEESNDAYAIAKISGIKMCDYYSHNYKLNFKSLMPPNLYGPNDNYDLNKSHFYPALIRKIHNAKNKNLKELTVWGSGKPKRELMFVNDFADAVIFFMNKKIKEPFLNIGTGKDFPIRWYANFIMKKLNVKLKIKYDYTKPDGMPKKCLNINRAKKYGWKPKNNFDNAFKITYEDFLKKVII